MSENAQNIAFFTRFVGAESAGLSFFNEHNHYRLSLAWKLHMPSVLSARKDSSTCVTKRSPLSCHCWKSFVIQRRQLARRFARCSKIFERCPVNKHTHTNEVFGARHPFLAHCAPGLSLARPPAHATPTQICAGTTIQPSTQS